MVADNVHSANLSCLTAGWLWTWSKTWCAVGLWFQPQLVPAALGEAFRWAGFLGLDLIHTKLFGSSTKKRKKERKEERKKGRKEEKHSLDFRNSHRRNPHNNDDAASGQPVFLRPAMGQAARGVCLLALGAGTIIAHPFHRCKSRGKEQLQSSPVFEMLPTFRSFF